MTLPSSDIHSRKRHRLFRVPTPNPCYLSHDPSPHKTKTKTRTSNFSKSNSAAINQPIKTRLLQQSQSVRPTQTHNSDIPPQSRRQDGPVDNTRTSKFASVGDGPVAAETQFTQSGVECWDVVFECGWERRCWRRE